MKHWRSLALFAAIALPILLIACGGKGAAEYQTLINQLHAAGANVATTSDGVQLPLTGSEQSLKVNGELVEVYIYESTGAANADAAGISPDGQTIKEDQVILTLNISASPPHFYKKDLLIAFYSGSTSAVLNALQSALGPEIAGS